MWFMGGNCLCCHHSIENSPLPFAGSILIIMALVLSHETANKMWEHDSVMIS